MTKNEFVALVAEALDVQVLSADQEIPEIDSLSILNLIDLYEMHGVVVSSETFENVRTVKQLIDLAGQAING